MSGTLASASAVIFLSIVVGQAVLVACGWRGLSWLAPAMGLAVLCTVAGITIRAPGHASTAIAAITVIAAASVLLLVLRPPTGLSRALAVGLPMVAVGLAAALIPFVARGRFGILGTGFNPDMQQHLLIADWLFHRVGRAPSYVRGGYPLGPHALVVAISKASGVGLVQAFDGLTVAIAPLTALTAYGALRALAVLQRMVVALLAAFAYLAAAYLAQGAFKETIMALFLIALAVGLWDLLERPAGAPRSVTARALPLLVLAPASVYVYSFPGLVLLGAVAVLWAVLEPRARDTLLERRGQVTAVLAGGAVLAVPLVAIKWHSVSKFFTGNALNPAGRSLGNLFHSLNPLEAFGVWPTGDYRLNPGEGHVPTVVWYAAALFGVAAFLIGLVRWWSSGERALPATLAVAAVVYAGTALAASPYTAAKSLAVAAPLVLLIAAGGLLMRKPAAPAQLIALALIVAAGGSSLLALGKAQVGPTAYTPALDGLRGAVKGRTVLALIPPKLAAQRGGEFVTWDLRGSDRIAKTAGPPSPASLPKQFQLVVSYGGAPPFGGLRVKREEGGWRVWERRAG